MYASTRRVVEGKEPRAARDSGRAGHKRPVGRDNAAVAPEDGPNLFERRFWPFACGVVLIWVLVRVFDFTLLPPTYKGLVITQPFYGLHSWDLADRAWAARSHLKYGLGYTKGLRTLVVGDPPPLIPGGIRGQSPISEFHNWVESRPGAVVVDKQYICIHTPFPGPAHRTGRADLPHPALRRVLPSRYTVSRPTPTTAAVGRLSPRRRTFPETSPCHATTLGDVSSRSARRDPTCNCR